MKFTLLSSLGMTEGTAGVTVSGMNDSLETRSGTVGHFMAHMEGKIIDQDSGSEVVQGTIGEICVRGYSVMKGYYKNPELTASVVDGEGWLHSGDLGFLDKNGNLHLMGRKKDLIIRGGENICSVDVEVCILEIEGVYACRVVGVPDAHFGEKVCAMIIPQQGMKIDKSIIVTQLRSKLEKKMIPEIYLFMDTFPLNEIGKIDSVKLKRIAKEYAEQCHENK